MRQTVRLVSGTDVSPNFAIQHIQTLRPGFTVSRCSCAATGSADATIVFRTADVVCTDTTNHNGEAICSSNDQFDRTRFHPTGADPLTYPYTARFAGDPALEASTATGSLQKATGSG